MPTNNHVSLNISRKPALPLIVSSHALCPDRLRDCSSHSPGFSVVARSVHLPAALPHAVTWLACTMLLLSLTPQSRKKAFYAFNALPPTARAKRQTLTICEPPEQ